MSFLKSASVLTVAAALSITSAGFASHARAADMPVKAVPVIGPSAPLDVHGFVDYTIASNRVTGGGLYLYPRGTLSQINGKVSLDLYKDPTGFINSVSIYGGVWNEFWSNAPAGTRSWQEMDMYAGVSFGFAKSWNLTTEYVSFNFPTGLPTASNYVFTLGYDDSGWGLPVAFNPYVTLFYNGAGGSTVVYGKRSGGYRVTVGVSPSFTPFKGVPLSLTVPISYVFGPSDFWNRADGTTNVCGTTGTLPCATSSSGMFSAGLQAKYSLESVIPKRLGNWYVKGGVQYYHIYNEALLAGQVATGAVTSYANAKRDIAVWSTGVGFSF